MEHAALQLCETAQTEGAAESIVGRSMNKQVSKNFTGKASIAPPPEWANVRAVDSDFKAQVPGHVTVLLWDIQADAEKSAVYHRVVQRLETLDAVEGISQFKIDFDSGSQEIVIHSIAVVRNGQRVEQTALSPLHFLQREESLEAGILHGWTTLLLLLENVLVGDTIDASYTIRTTAKILPDRFYKYFSLPMGVPVRNLHVDVRFAGTRPMQWKSSSKDWQPAVQQGENEIRLEWKREMLHEAMPEPNLPAWYTAGSWIQVTDCQSWEDVVTGYVDAWPFETGCSQIPGVAEAITANARTEEDRVDRVITYVQDGFRYLSVNIESGGGIPSSPDDVIRRRFGDCKDLSLLMTLLLRAIGVPARPVLVDSRLAARVRDFLPMPVAFNHAVVEYEVLKERRWVDPVRRLQGGGAKNRPVENYGFGLALDPGVKELGAMPAQNRHAGVYRLKESFWLNSAGLWSILDVEIMATGAQAEFFRNLFARQPAAQIEAEREQCYAKMFAQAKRVGKIVHKDYRLRNEFALAERYEIAGALQQIGDSARAYFAHAGYLVQNAFRPFPQENRKHPNALPFPCNIEHVIEIDFPGLETGDMPPYNKRHPLFHLARKSKYGVGYHTVTYSFESQADSVLPDQLVDFRKVAEEALHETEFFVELPLNVRGRRPKNPLPQLAT